MTLSETQMMTTGIIVGLEGAKKTYLEASKTEHDQLDQNCKCFLCRINKDIERVRKDQKELCNGAS